MSNDQMQKVLSMFDGFARTRIETMLEHDQDLKDIVVNSEQEAMALLERVLDEFFFDFNIKKGA